MANSSFKYWEHPVCKFYSFNSFNQDIFSKLRIHLSSPVLFNDPFEGLNDDMPFLEHDSLVTCFTGLKRETGNSKDTLFNPLMWSHYANSHKGFSIVFDPLIAGLFPVKYIKDRPKKYNYHNTITSKGDAWSYENEFRFIGSKAPSDLGRIEYENGEFYLKFYPDDIKAIVFGCRANKSDISKLMNYIFAFSTENEIGKRKLESLAIKKLKLKEDVFELEAAESFIFVPTKDPKGKKSPRWTILPDVNAHRDEEGSIKDILRIAPLNNPSSRPETPDRIDYKNV